jgi:competence protein ComEC
VPVRAPRLSPAVILAIGILVAVGLARSDEIRARAEAGLGRGMPAREAELARGFVLGADEEIDPRTEEDFRRAGLSHLLAVSGQNVTLLGLLAMPLLAALGIPLRERLLWTIGLIALYVPLAGAGPSIQRAGVMGAVGLLATLSGRRASRLYALSVALVVTLAIDPGIAADVGWQLSFAAVAGIFVLAAPLRAAISARIGRGELRRALSDGIAMTVAATLATAPLIAFHFETFSTTTLLANVLALPAVAPAMWLGMASAAAAQVPGLPIELLNLPNALLLGYVAQVAAWCGRPGWAELEVSLGSGGLAGAYLALAGATALAFRLARWRRLAVVRRDAAAPVPPVRRDRSQLAACLAAVAIALVLLSALTASRGEATTAPRPGLRIEVIDVGQGDAILLQPARAPAVLVDGGPGGTGLEDELREAGVERLAAAVVTHDQADHSGGVEELLGRFPISRLVYGRLGREPLRAARSAGARPVQVAAGGHLRSGGLRLDVLWPPRELLAEPVPGADPNRLAVVLLARWRGFSMLLSADAEAEAVPLDPGPLDVLKVAHHGSDDAGLGSLLNRARPALATISVGEGNSYGHPTGGTVGALEGHGVEVLRTDRDGDIVIEVRRGSIEVQRQG